MLCEFINIASTVSPLWPIGGSKKTFVVPPSPEIEVDFKCLKCGTAISGYGRGFKVAPNGTSLEEFVVARLKGNLI